MPVRIVPIKHESLSETQAEVIERWKMEAADKQSRQWNAEQERRRQLQGARRQREQQAAEEEGRREQQRDVRRQRRQTQRRQREQQAAEEEGRREQQAAAAADAHARNSARAEEVERIAETRLQINQKLAERRREQKRKQTRRS